MAGVTFMDLLLAQALAAGLEREARSDSPPPENFFRLPSDPEAWRNVQEACKKENMVVALEITDGSFPQQQREFMDLAREFDNIPFMRVQIGAGDTFDKLREDLGGVQYVPTFLVVFFGDDGTYRAKYERIQPIREALESGRFKEVIKEFMERRVKLKAADRLASNLAEHVNAHMNDKERQIRQEYETRMKRQMAERDEQLKKEEQGKKQKEEEEQQKQDKEKMRDNERRKQARPQHIAQLKKLNLTTAPIRQIKTIMQEMGIGIQGCLERGDLVERLMDCCPELRLSQKQPQRAITVSTEATDGAPYSSSSVSADFQARKAKNDMEDMKKKISLLESQLAIKTKEIESLRKANKSSAVAIQRPGSNADDRVREMEAQLLESRTLYTTTLTDIDAQGVIHLPGTEDEGLILRVKCTNKRLPNPGRVYAMKVLTDYLRTLTQTQVRATFQNEYNILFQLPIHKNIIKMWAFFYDRTDPRICELFKKLKPNAQNKFSLFLLMDEHTTSMKDWLDTLGGSEGPKPAKVAQWLRDLLEGLVFLETHNVVHRDLKLDNLLMDDNGSVVISDFGNAVVLDDTMKLQYIQGYGSQIIGGNTAHLSPEVLNTRPGQLISYLKQPVWAAAVLAYELAGHSSPFEGGNVDQRGYHISEVTALETTMCKKSDKKQSLPPALTKLVCEMLDSDPDRRPTLRACLKRVSEINM